MVKGLKHDENKLRYDLIPPEVEEELAKVLTYGAVKYAPNSWRGVEADRYLAAAGRHRIAHQRGELYDKESGLLHLSHLLCNVAFLLAKQIEELEGADCESFS